MAVDIQGIAFDWGGVLIENPAQAIADWILNHTGISPEFMKHLPEDLLVKFQKGQVSEEEFWDSVETELELNISTKTGLWRSAFEASYLPQGAMFDLVAQIQKKGLRTAILSNTEMPAVHFFREQNYSQFDIELFSCELGMAKPDRDIYEAAIEVFGLVPEKIVFIDDKPENIEAARVLGMRGIVFGTEEQVRGELRELGLQA